MVKIGVDGGNARRGRMRGHTWKGVLLGSEGGDEGILLFLGWAWQESRLLDRFGNGWRRDHGRRGHNLRKGFTIKEGEVLLPGELWWSGHREI